MADRVWTDAMDTELLDRIEAGETYAAAGRALGVTKNAVIGRYNRLSGYAQRKREPALGEIWGLTLCSELPTGLTEYVPVNPHSGRPRP